ncbi:MAG: mechanosensitive ion channel [Pseudolabrys sp.]
MTLRAGAFFSALSALLLLTAVAPAASAQVVGLPRVLAAAESGKAAPAAGDKKAAATDAKPAASDSKPAAAPAKAPASAPAKPEPDPFGRETPQGMVSGLMNALAAPDYERALQYFQTDQVPGVPRWYVLSGPRLAERFQQVLDHAGDVVTPAELSSSPSGNVNDGLPQNEERFGEIKADGRKVPLLAVRVKRDGKDLWLVSSKTLSEVPSLARILDVGAPGNSWLSRLPEGPTVFGAPASNWLALLLLAAVSFGFAWALAAQREPIERLLRRGGGETKLSGFIEKSAGPGRLLLALLLFGLALQGLGISVIARYRAMFAVQIIGWFAVAWLIWRWSDAAGEVVLSRMSQRGQLSAYSAISFLTRAFKALLAALFLAALLRAFGVNVTAGLAALGVGGLAVALGAQKLFENLIGSLTVLADRPVRVGDFCRFGSTLGTVEEIGIRSTRIRTLDRTVLTVPNGEFANRARRLFARRRDLRLCLGLGLCELPGNPGGAAALLHADRGSERHRLRLPLLDALSRTRRRARREAHPRGGDRDPHAAGRSGGVEGDPRRAARPARSSHPDRIEEAVDLVGQPHALHPQGLGRCQHLGGHGTGLDGPPGSHRRCSRPRGRCLVRPARRCRQSRAWPSSALRRCRRSCRQCRQYVQSWHRFP